MDVVVLVVLGVLLGGARSAPTPEVAPPELALQPPVQGLAPVTYVSRHHAQDELGQVNYGFSHPGQTKNEVRDASGNVAGAYSYVGDDDKVVVVEYTAGEGGFQVKSNNLPVGVQDTPEVLAAKLQFVEQYNAAALAAAAAADQDRAERKLTSDSDVINLGPVQGISNPVKDTPEVIAAKLQFVDAYNAAALAAARAPDDDESADSSLGFVVPKTPANPVKDTPEVIAAKLTFVEAYNAAALAAAKASDDPDKPDSSKVTIVYAVPAVENTPEVIAAKLQFVESFNDAAMKAAAASSEQSNSESTTLGSLPEPNPSTEYPFEDPIPVTELGIHEGPDDDKVEAVESTTFFPISSSLDKRNERKLHVLKPKKLEESPTDDYQFRTSSGIGVPQAHSYGAAPPSEPVPVPVVKVASIPSPPVELQVPDVALQPNTLDQVAGVPVEYVSRHHAQDESGRVSYGFSHPGQAKNEIRDESGNVAGVYTYVDENEKVVRVEYTAGENGFQVKSNNLPVAVGDTPEVLAAKLQFVEAYNAAAIAAAAAPDDEEVDANSPTHTTFAIPNPVQDTPEVIAAKLQFVEAYNAAALAAAQAPDEPTEYTSLNTDDLFVNPNPVQDTPEVVAAKLQFVEAYNAASLAAAKAADHPDVYDTSKAAITYAYHPVQDTPEVIAAKIQFVEAYNAAALAAAIAPDDDEIQHVLQNSDSGDTLTQTVSQTAGPSENQLDVPAVVVSEIPTELQVPNVELQPIILDEVAGVPVEYVSKHHAQDELGQVSYGFSAPDQAKNEIRDAAGNVAGVYTYIDENDKVVRVEYTAGKDGFQVWSNNLPIAVGDTPEVLAAKLQFVDAYNAAALAAAAAPDDAATDSDNPTSTAFVVPGHVQDTPEVLAAKLQFAEAYNVAALAAAQAPDDPTEYTPLNADDVIFENPNPVKDTPEVIAAKLQFVEDYNAASLAAAKAANHLDIYDTSRTTTLANAYKAVQDTPEVIAAKLQFIEAYNAAALAAAIAPDDDEEVHPEQKEYNSEPQLVAQGSEIFPAQVQVVPVPQLNEETHIHVPVILPQPSASSEIRLGGAADGLSTGSPVIVQPEVYVVPAQSPVAVAPAQASSSAAVPETYITKHHAQDELGQVNYGYSHPGQTKNEVRDASGNVAGIYTYIDSDDKIVRVEYTAGEDGFQVRSNNLPIAPGDTPEVLKAKMEFVEAYNAAALAAAAAPDDEEHDSSSQSKIVSPVPVSDTPEVLAAKLQFVKAYNAAAIAAAAAPDDFTSSVGSNTGTATLVSPNPVRDTPEVIAAKLQFVEQYNANTLVAAASDPTVYTMNAVQDTPEVIAAKLRFVEEYNAAAIRAALAQDDDEGNTTESPDVTDTLSTVENEFHESVTTGIPEGTESLNRVDETSMAENSNNDEYAILETFTQEDNLIEDTGSQSHTGSTSSKVILQPNYFSLYRPAYAGYVPGLDDKLSPQYTYSIPYGMYGYPYQSVQGNEISHTPYFVHVPLIQRIPGGPQDQATMYAPAYSHLA